MNIMLICAPNYTELKIPYAMTIPAKAAITTPKSPVLTWLPAPLKAIGLPVAPGTLTEEASVVPAVGPGT